MGVTGGKPPVGECRRFWDNTKPMLATLNRWHYIHPRYRIVTAVTVVTGFPLYRKIAVITVTAVMLFEVHQPAFCGALCPVVNAC